MRLDIMDKKERHLSLKSQRRGCKREKQIHDCNSRPATLAQKSGWSPRPRSSPSPTKIPTSIPLSSDVMSLTRYRTPSVSPSRTFVKADIIPTTMNNVEQRFYSFGPADAYFSSIPPVQPLNIVLVGDAPENVSLNGRYQRLIENLRRLEAIADSGYGNSGEPTDGATFESESSLPAPDVKQKFRSRSRCRRRNGPTDSNTLQGKSLSSTSVIKCCLRELIANLPLSRKEVISPSVTASELSRDPSTGAPEKPSIKSQTMTRTFCNSPRRRSKCSIAIQALTNQYCASETSRNGVGPEELPEEWVGGVRALRDSHVRLVLRQLRHIDRLNRALDRAARAPYAAAAAAAARRASRPISVPR